MSDQEKMREEFESDAAPYGYVLTKASCPCCTYADDATENRWKGWQASRAQSYAEIAKRDDIIAMQAEALKNLIAHAMECEKELDEFHGMGSDSGSGCSEQICNAQTVLSASAESVATWEAQHAAKVLEEAANSFADESDSWFVRDRLNDMATTLRAKSAQKKEG